MRKSLLITSTLALSLGAASAQDTTTPATTATPATTTQTTPATTTNQTTTTTPASQVVTFSDVPAGQYAKDAVDFIVQRGLIQGFPDGTFRGNENLTRYQAALIFYRLLQSGNLGNAGLSQTDLTTITRGIQEVSTELAAITTRVTDLERLSAEQQARITALEERINALGTANTGTATTDVTALTARIDALEAAVRNIPAAPAGASSADLTALTARVSALEAAAQNTTATTTPTTTTPTDTTATDTTTTTPAPGTVVIGDTTPVATTPTRGNLFAGVSVGVVNAGAQLGNCFVTRPPNRPTNLCASFGGVVGSTSVIGPVGARVAVDYRPGPNAISADVNATIGLGSGRLQPYAGLGLGLTSSRSRTAGTNANATDTYLSALVGVDFQITNNISAFAEADARYYLSNRGLGAVQNSTATNARGFGNAVKAGLKFYF